MGAEDLIIVVRQQIPHRVAECNRLLQAHHYGIGKTTQQHHQSENHIHDPDLLVVDAGDPIAPQRAPSAEIGQRSDDRQAADHDRREGGEQNRFMKGNRVPSEAPENEFSEVRMLGHEANPDRWWPTEWL